MASTEADVPTINGNGLNLSSSRKADTDDPLVSRTPPRLSSSDFTPLDASDEDGETGIDPSSATDSGAASTHSAGYLPSDPTSGIPSALLGSTLDPNIDEESPAAEALRANAGIHVRKTTKLARKIHVQTVRKFVKKATLRGMGNRRGKPPRIPPSRAEPDENGIFIVEEGEDEDSDSSGFSTEDGKISGEVEIPASDRSKKLVGFEGDAKLPVEVINATMETGKKLLAFADPHEIIQTQRWRRRRKRGVDKNRKSYVKGKVIDGEHELYTLSIAVMLGVRTSIGTTNTRIASEQKRWLTSDDFMNTEKYMFRPSGGPKTPPHQLGHTFKFKDYSPAAFAYLRRVFGVNEFDFLVSVCGNANFIEFISNAKSGQFFFYSSDGKFMIKTMTNAESKFLRRILPHYFRHCCKNPNTMLTKFLGMYRVKLYHLRRNVKFVIMNSVYYTDKYLQTFYDLKGSVTGRDARPGQDVKKDNDLRRSMPDGAVALEPHTRLRVRAQIVADCDFMKRMKIMDYSLLVGIHHIPPKGKGVKVDKNVGKTGFRFSDARKESMKFRELLRTSLRDAASVGHQSLPTTLASDDEHDPFARSTASLPTLANPIETDENGSPTRLIKTGSERSLGSASPFHARPTNKAGNIPAISPGISDLTRDDSRDGEKPFAHLAMYEHGLDDDDDNSYLEGSANNPIVKPLPSVPSDLELKKEQTIEQVYWPFHRLFDISGYRRVVPGRCATCGSVDCTCDISEEDKLKHGKVAPFVPPISDRKDGGLMMDCEGYDMPMKFKTGTGREHVCEGKIFYVGIIDILQQYNTRKRVEAKYRRVSGSGWHDASCVHPDVYAERFVSFFDEFSQRDPSKDVTLADGEEGVLFESCKPSSKSKEERKEEEEA